MTQCNLNNLLQAINNRAKYVSTLAGSITEVVVDGAEYGFYKATGNANADDSVFQEIYDSFSNEPSTKKITKSLFKLLSDIMNTDAQFKAVELGTY